MIGNLFYIGKSISKLQIDVGYFMFEWNTWGYDGSISPVAIDDI
jgi:hypothetical protein